MSNDTRTAVGVLVTFLLGAILAITAWMDTETGVYPSPGTSAPAVTSTTSVCYEDEPCWDCATMGNGLCGPVDIGTALVCDRIDGHVSCRELP